MKVAVFGLGYVGAVTSVCLAKMGHTVVGVDVDDRKVRLLSSGDPPFSEPDLPVLLKDVQTSGLFRTTTVASDAVIDADVILISVGTPSRHDGAPDTAQVTRVLQQIGENLSRAATGAVVALRSTVPPGTTRDIAVPLLERSSGLLHGRDFHVCFNPEFLREGSAVADFFSPARTVVGATSEAVTDVMRRLYATIDAPLYIVDTVVAELVKYVDNTWHAVKVAFANEVGTLAHSLGATTDQVVKIFLDDNKLNLSPYYLRPGTPFGGSCLPKDVRAMNAFASRSGHDFPLIASILKSNKAHLDRMLSLCMSPQPRNALLVGLSFKVGTDDLRESPLLHLAEYLVGKGVELHIYDSSLFLDSIHGSNMAFLCERLPHIARLLTHDPLPLLASVDTVIVGKKDPLLRKLRPLLRNSHSVVDLVGIEHLRNGGWRYHGLCWK